MKNSKPVSTPLAIHFKLSKRLCPSMEKEKGEMSNVCYGVYTSKYISCGWSCEQIPNKSW